jgi:hypothetical protein
MPVYQINKGINKSIEFKGLKAQYIWYFGGMVVGLLFIFAILYLIGAPSWFCIALCGGSGTYGSIQLFRLSHTYGEHGLMKTIAKKRVPKALRSYGRKHFQRLDHPFKL